MGQPQGFNANIEGGSPAPVSAKVRWQLMTVRELTGPGWEPLALSTGHPLGPSAIVDACRPLQPPLPKGEPHQPAKVLISRSLDRPGPPRLRDRGPFTNSIKSALP